MEDEPDMESILRAIREMYENDRKDVPDPKAPPVPEETERAIREWHQTGIAITPGRTFDILSL